MLMIAVEILTIPQAEITVKELKIESLKIEK